MTATVLAVHPSRLTQRCNCTARLAPQDDDLFFFAAFFVGFFFAGFFAAPFFAAFATTFFATFRPFGRLRKAASRADASAALAQSPSSSESSNSRAGNSQYELTV